MELTPSPWASKPIPKGIVVPFDKDPSVGNDDFDIPDSFPSEDNDPYSACNTEELQHGMNQLSDYDLPNLSVLSLGNHAPTGATLVEHFLAQEFVRVQANSYWMVISDPLKWHLTLKAKYTAGSSANDHSGTWSDNGSELGLGN